MSKVMVFDWEKADKLLEESEFNSGKYGLPGLWTDTERDLTERKELKSVIFTPEIKLGQKKYRCWKWEES